MTTTDLITFFTYLLALQKCPHSSDYTIHGLWIDYNKGGYPEFCRNIKYDENILSPLKSQLDTYWKSCYGSHTNSDLWKHEWQKHGTCFNPDITLYDYFNNTLKLYSKYKTKFNQKCHGKRECFIYLDYFEIIN